MSQCLLNRDLSTTSSERVCTNQLQQLGRCMTDRTARSCTRIITLLQLLTCELHNRSEATMFMMLPVNSGIAIAQV